MNTGSDSAEKSTDEYGITDEDIEQMVAYLRKPMHTRSVDDLRRSEKQ